MTDRTAVTERDTRRITAADGEAAHIHDPQSRCCCATRTTNRARGSRPGVGLTGALALRSFARPSRTRPRSRFAVQRLLPGSPIMDWMCWLDLWFTVSGGARSSGWPPWACKIRTGCAGIPTGDLEVADQALPQRWMSNGT
ncbi:hypothetical protein GCM10012284_53350 [Mangrovihabitans endophyticus]|uniref:Uncharacterized protein n=1 Tax=Mangrovihabitans endophyticus TaxID=1751298 RepID=A0A8J3FS39_9ACTN|nr:hypothetical protein GCM10012284_53350 [Mangrovihabitans endophyticus]